MIARYARLLLDAVAPRRCAGCDSVCDAAICPDCRAHLVGMRVPAARPMRWGVARAGFEFEEPVRRIVHHGKYGGDRTALRALAALTSDRLGTFAGPDAIQAMPLGPRRRRQRGYNQADVIAQVLADERQVPLLAGLRRTRDTAPQSTRDESGRRANVAGAFVWQGDALDSAGLWLVDDVLTTGATVEAAAAALGRAGASLIDAIVLAVVP